MSFDLKIWFLNKPDSILFLGKLTKSLRTLGFRVRAFLVSYLYVELIYIQKLDGKKSYKKQYRTSFPQADKHPVSGNYHRNGSTAVENFRTS
jgi:hypothetical protein